MIQIMYRPAEVVEGLWQLAGETSEIADVRDEIESWKGPSLGHGDLVYVRSKGMKSPMLFVFDSDRSSLVEPETVSVRGWVSLWEGSRSEASTMLRECAAVDRRRTALAACACVEMSLPYVLAGEERPRLAIEAARRAIGGQATGDDVRAAAMEAMDAIDEMYTPAGRTRGQYPYGFRSSQAAIMAAVRVADAASASWNYDDFPAAVSSSFLAAMRARPRVDVQSIRRAMAREVRRRIPLSVLACSLVGARDPLPLPRENTKGVSKR
jgi:hypothetical protein